jgi:four helix bundle protein
MASMRREELAERTRSFALRVIRLVSSLPKGRVADVIGGQVLRSGISIGANYREATRAATKRHFASILATALREADETLYWLELVRDAKLVRVELLRGLVDECNQLVAILAASVKTAANRTERRVTKK